MTDEKILAVTKAVLEALRNTAIVATFGYLYSVNDALYLAVLFYAGSAALVLNIGHQMPRINLDIKLSSIARLNRVLSSSSSFLIRIIPATILVGMLGQAVTDFAAIQKKQSSSKTLAHENQPCRFTLDLTGHRCN